MTTLVDLATTTHLNLDEFAKEGMWIDGPGKELFDEETKDYDFLSVIAEDLGFLTLVLKVWLVVVALRYGYYSVYKR